MYRCVQVPVNLGGLYTDGVVLVQVGCFWLHPCIVLLICWITKLWNHLNLKGGGNFSWIMLIHEDVISWILRFSVSVRKLALS